MAPVLSTLSLLGGLHLLLQAGTTSAAAIDPRAALSPYVPTSVACPTTPLLRPAKGLGASESAYVTARKSKADVSLAAWLAKTDPAFSNTTLPSLGLAISGGGLRSLLSGAGVFQAFDSRDSTSGTSGLFQSLTYQSGLSGGGWLTSSVAGGNWPTISSIKASLWERTFQDSLLLPENLLFAVAYADIVVDIIDKSKAGYTPTLVDPYGRLLSYMLLNGTSGGVATTLSGLTGLSNFVDHNVSQPHP